MHKGLHNATEKETDEKVKSLYEWVLFLGLGIFFYFLKTKTSSLAYGDQIITLVPQRTQNPFT
jgi:hypothetical protein